MMYFSKIYYFFISFIFLSPKSFCMRSNNQGDTSCLQEMSNFPPNIYPQGQNIPQGPINKIMPHDDESYNKAIDSILKCIDVLECYINNVKVLGNEVHLEGGFYEYLNDRFDNDVRKYNYKNVSVSGSPLLWCDVLLRFTANSILECSILENDAECKEVCQCLINPNLNVFVSESNKSIKGGILFKDFYNVVDVAFKLYSCLNKYSRHQVNVSNERITDGYVYTFLSHLRDIFISVNKVLPIEENISEEFIHNKINECSSLNLFKNLFNLLLTTMLSYDYFHKELVSMCGEKVKFEQGTDFHSLFIDLIKKLCYVYNIFNEVIINQKQLYEFKKICDVGMFKEYVETIKKNITEIFKFISKNSKFFTTDDKGYIETGNIDYVGIGIPNMNDEGDGKFLGLVGNITKKKGMYVNTKKINQEYFNNNYNHLSMNYINDDYFLNDARFGKEGNVRKPLGEIIDNVTSNRSSCCCSCQVRSR